MPEKNVNPSLRVSGVKSLANSMETLSLNVMPIHDAKERPYVTTDNIIYYYYRYNGTNDYRQSNTSKVHEHNNYTVSSTGGINSGVSSPSSRCSVTAIAVTPVALALKL